MTTRARASGAGQHAAEPPPPGASWRTLYLLLLAELAALVALFYALTRWAA